jgi:DNA-binding GntR family transcriptional regulator
MRASAEPSSLAAEAYAFVRQRILRGDIGLGEVISRRKLAAELKMSFLPVSEALLRLQFEGLLESRPRAGTRVRIPSPEDVRGHYIVREALEVQAAIRFTLVATAVERRELVRLAARVDALARQPHRVPYVRAHQRLHARIAQCARCPALVEAIEKTHALASIWLCAIRTPRADDPPARHRELAEAVVSGDPDRAAVAVRAHIAEGLSRALEVLQPYFRLRRVTGRTFRRKPWPSSQRGEGFGRKPLTPPR